jgi:hypothetical protein
MAVMLLQKQKKMKKSNNKEQRKVLGHIPMQQLYMHTKTLANKILCVPSLEFVLGMLPIQQIRVFNKMWLPLAVARQSICLDSLHNMKSMKIISTKKFFKR